MLYRLFIVAFVLLLVSSCLRITYSIPNNSFESYNIFPEPNYANNNSWAALPVRDDNADLVPNKFLLKNNQDSASVDVFYIHPTSFNGKEWNASVENNKVNKRTDNLAIRHQASVFNGSCKIYAPRYRQATLYSFVDTSDNCKNAVDFAYQDVRKAFEYYLSNWNNNRPIIIAAHSQGTAHAIQLIKDFFDGKELINQLVVAYLIGMPVNTNTFSAVAPCNNEGETKCFVSWITFAWNKKTRNFENIYKTNLHLYQYNHNTINCTNPLSWKTDTIYQEKQKNKGSVPVSFKKVEKQVCDAQAYDGVLWVHLSKKKGYPSFPNGNYHPVDYNLFYINMRENVKQRIESFYRKQE
jgi:hypothetical protein